MKTDRRTHPRGTPDDIGAGIRRRSLRPLLGALLLLLLGWSSAAPAGAESGTISGSRSGPIDVNPGETLNIVGGAQISGSLTGVSVNGGTVNISGGSISGANDAVLVNSGTVNISGGSISTHSGVGVALYGGEVNVSGGSISSAIAVGVYVVGGTVNILGGSISAFFGVVNGGAVSITGCPLSLASDGTLVGTLADGTSINTMTFGLGPCNLKCTCCPDTSAPTTTATATAGGNPYTAGTWTNQDVTVSLQATDPDGSCDVSKITYSASGAQTISSTDAVGASAPLPTITAEGITTASFHATDQANNGESPGQTFAAQIDKTTPKTIASPSGPLGANGWYTGPVAVTLSASDANGSLPVSGVKQTLYNLDGAGFQDYASLPASGIPISGNGTHTLAFYSLDAAGNVEDQTNAGNTLTVKIDGTAPSTSADWSGTAGSSGWYRSAVNVTLSATDAASGVASTSYRLDGSASQSYTGAIAVSGDGTHTLTFASTDNAGNLEATQSVTVKIDTVAPTLQVGSPDGLWQALDVSIPVTASDATSGLANPADARFSLATSVPAGTETSSAATNSQPVIDAAGNSATAGPVSGIKVDKKAPAISISTPAAGAVYFLHQAVAARYAVTDGGSGVNSSLSGGPVVNGSRLDTRTVGSRTFTVTGGDNVGNTATPQSVNYAVGYQIVALYDPTKYVNSGSTAPIKLQLTDANGVNVSAASIVLNALQVTKTGSLTATKAGSSGSSNPDNNFRYDATKNSYVYNLSTAGLTSGSYTLSFTAGSDPTLHTVSFQVK